MVGEHRLTDVAITAPPWPLLIEVAEATPPRSWVLMGGMKTFSRPEQVAAREQFTRHHQPR